MTIAYMSNRRLTEHAQESYSCIDEALPRGDDCAQLRESKDSQLKKLHESFELTCRSLKSYRGEKIRKILSFHIFFKVRSVLCSENVATRQHCHETYVVCTTELYNHLGSYNFFPIISGNARQTKSDDEAIQEQLTTC